MTIDSMLYMLNGLYHISLDYPEATYAIRSLLDGRYLDALDWCEEGADVSFWCYNDEEAEEIFNGCVTILEW